MIVKIIDNHIYREWTDRYIRTGAKNEIHYFPGDIFYVIPYRHNHKDFYEALWDTLSSKQRLLCPVITGEHIFWIEKLVTEQVEYDMGDSLEYSLPNELFEI